METLIGLLIGIAIIVSVIYTQNKFINTLRLDDEIESLHKAWIWLEILLFSILFIVVLYKITNRYNDFAQKHFSSENEEITEFKPLWGWLFVIFFTLVSVFPLFTLVAMPFLILHLINMNKVIKDMQNTMKFVSDEQ